MQTYSKAVKKIVYQIMHKDRLTAEVSSLGEAVIHEEQFMPYDLFLSDENDDFETTTMFSITGAHCASFHQTANSPRIFSTASESHRL